MSDGGRFFVAKTYVTESKSKAGYSEWGWHVFVVTRDGTVVQLDDFYCTENEALSAAAAEIHAWQDAVLL